MTVFTRDQRPVPLDDLVRELRRVLEAHGGVEQAYLFGSYARGAADEMSDLDVVIVAPSERRFVRRFEDYRELDELGPPVEPFIYTPEEFEQLLEEERPFVMRAIEEGVRLL